VSRYQNLGKTNLDFTEVRDSEWQWYQLGHMQVCTLRQTDNHASNPPLRWVAGWCAGTSKTNSTNELVGERDKTIATLSYFYRDRAKVQNT